MSLIERSFREKIVLVGVTLPPRTTGGVEARLKSRPSGTLTN